MSSSAMTAYLPPMALSVISDPGRIDPVLDALDNAPLGERFSPEQEAELSEALEDIRAGRARLVPHAEIEDHRPRQAG